MSDRASIAAQYFCLENMRLPSSFDFRAAAGKSTSFPICSTFNRDGTRQCVSKYVSKYSRGYRYNTFHWFWR